ncbi:protein-methionine-sulfoxide reductase heme-binding subunit MsrQ [Siccirubricoccus phaeus]|uniref:sulfite oxidase heme-binding subunit YedZ n=1 Tax=Siccirubricoccus phaeus TaxID=2595053 RepID=UPI001F471662|nr:ferric reductase-like transmembrane domain-containing protein [Siccirubricoccus phaeus]
MMQAMLRAAFPPALPPGRARPFPFPWRDRAGRFSWLKAATFALLLAPGAWVAWLAAADGLGPEPWKDGLREIGLWAIRLLLLTLAVTPFARLLAWPRLATLRRMIGLGALGYALLHLAMYAANENFRLLHIAGEIALRFYLTIGFVALLAMAALGWTSTDGWVRALGRRWKRLHLLIWPIAALGVFHFFLQSPKSGLWEAVLAAGLLLWLAFWRLLPAGWRANPLALLALAPAAALGAALVEYAWYALGTNLPAAMILAANLDVGFELRPAVWAGLVALAVPAVACLRKIMD